MRTPYDASVEHVADLDQAGRDARSTAARTLLGPLAERDVVGPLRRLVERADRGDAAADDAEVQRRDRHPGDGAAEQLVPRGEHPGEQRRPAEREREVEQDGGGEERARRALAGQVVEGTPLTTAAASPASTAAALTTAGDPTAAGARGA